MIIQLYASRPSLSRLILVDSSGIHFGAVGLRALDMGGLKGAAMVGSI